MSPGLRLGTPCVRCTSGQSTRFGLEVGLRVDVGRVERDVTQPGADRIDVDACAQKMGCGGVPDHMRD